MLNISANLISWLQATFGMGVQDIEEGMRKLDGVVSSRPIRFTSSLFVDEDSAVVFSGEMEQIRRFTPEEDNDLAGVDLGFCHVEVSPSSEAIESAYNNDDDDDIVDDHRIIANSKSVSVVVKESTRADLNLLEVLCTVWRMDFLGREVSRKTAELLETYCDPQGTKLTMMKDVVVEKYHWKCNLFSWAGLQAQRVEAIPLEEGYQVLLHDIESLPSWLGSFKPTKGHIPKVELRLEQGEAHVIFPSLSFCSTEEPKPFDLVSLVQSLRRYGFRSFKCQGKTIRFVLESNDDVLLWQRPVISLNLNDQDQWSLQVRMKALLLPNCARLDDLKIEATLEADLSSIHLLKISAGALVLLEETTVKVTSLLRRFVAATEKLHVPHVKIEPIRTYALSQNTINDFLNDGTEDIPGWEGDDGTMMSDAFQHYANLIKEMATTRAARTSNATTRMTDTLATSAGLVAAAVPFGTAISRVTSNAALKVKDSVVSTAAKGAAGRGDKDGSYRFGDITRGIIAMFRDDDDDDDDNNENDGTVDTNSKEDNVAKEQGAVDAMDAHNDSPDETARVRRQDNNDKAHESVPAKRNTQNEDSDTPQPLPSPPPAAAKKKNNNKGYRFGDITRGILAKGKQADGRSKDSPYKFGDFTRGLFNM